MAEISCSLDSPDDCIACGSWYWINKIKKGEKLNFLLFFSIKNPPSKKTKFWGLIYNLL
jgi:hypothetical protein